MLQTGLPSFTHADGLKFQVLLRRTTTRVMLFLLILFLSTLVEFAEGSCSNPIRLGVEDGRVQDSQLSAKTYAGTFMKANAGRLNVPKIPSVSSGAWRAEHGDNTPWIQVDFLRPVTVTGVITQGRANADQWATTYVVKYRDDESLPLETISTTFTGNVDRLTQKENTLPTPITSRFFRISPKTWKNYCAMRFEFVGCYIGCRDSAPLGFANGLIHASQITGSSYFSRTWAPQFGRLVGEVNWNGWRSADDDSDPWFQVDFIAKVIVEEVQTHGCVDKLMWIKTYKLLYGDDDYDFTEYSENGVPKIFNGNTDDSTVVGNKITATIARYFRIKLLTCENKYALHVEFIGCYQDCASPGTALGLEDGSIKDFQLNATSFSTEEYGQQYGRLNYDSTFGGWLHASTDADPWFEVNLIKDALISGVATQGGGVHDNSKWMKTFEFSYGIDGTNFAFYKFDGQTKVFKANYDHSSVVKHNLPSTIYARFIRIHPKACKQACVMRAEIYGCLDGLDNCASVTCQNNGNCTDLLDSFKCECPSGYLGYLCDLNCPFETDLGLGDGSIIDSQITASSTTTAVLNAGAVRLDTTENVWIPKTFDYNSWLQVEFQEIVNITIIKTQGGFTEKSFVRTFSVSYGDDGTNFQDYKDAGRTKIFKVNVDSSGTVLNYFMPNINARYFRIHVLSFEIQPNLRMELTKCSCTVVPAGMKSTEIRDNQITASSNFGIFYTSIYARLDHPKGYWTPANSDYDNPWLQVDFKSEVTVDGIDTQGGGLASYVKTFTVNKGSDGILFDIYKEDNVEKIFIGNTDTSTVVHNIFSPRITSRYIRVNPRTHTTYISLRVEFYICDQVCQPTNPCLNTGGCSSVTPTSFACSCVNDVQGDLCQSCSAPIALGLESGDILDAQLTGSSEHSDGLKNTIFARLNQPAVTGVTSGGWAPDGLSDSWLQIDFRVNTTLTGISIQGVDDPTEDTRVTKFQIAYSQDGVTFLDHQENGEVKIFSVSGATNGSEVLHRDFNSSIIARYLRFFPVEWNGEYPGVRLDISGCTGVNFCLVNPCLNSGTCLQTDETGYQCDCPQGLAGQQCESCDPQYECLGDGYCLVDSDGTPMCVCPVGWTGYECEICLVGIWLGMETREIADEQITASSELDRQSLAKYGRLDNTFAANVGYGCWCPSWEDEQPWLQVNFSRMVTISNIKTQGRPDADEWVKSYELHYSSDNAVTFEAHKDVFGNVQTYIGNTNRDAHVTNGVNPVIYTQFIRIRPITWNDHVGLRVEFHGCNGVNYCLNNPCLNYGACVMYTDGFGCLCPSDYTGNVCQTYITPPPILPPTTSSGTTLPPTTSSGTTLPPTTSSETTLSPPSTSPTPWSTTLPPALQTTQSNIGETTQTNLNTDPTNPFTTSSAGITGSNSVPTGSVSTTMGYASIAGFVLNPIPAQEFGQSFSIGWVMTAGTNVTVVIAYSGVPCCNAIALSNTGGQCDCLISVPGLFDPDGVVNISAVASNLVSSIPAYIQIEVLKIITQVTFTMLTTHSDFGIGVEGRGSQKNVFPAEYPVKFNCSYTGGPATDVEWIFNCDVDGTIEESQFFFDKIFSSQSSQSCQITLRLQNSINSTLAHGSIELRESVIITSMTSNGPVKLNETISFTITLEKLGTQTCIWVDLGDNSNLLVFGDDSCPGRIDVSQVNPNIVSEPRLKFSFKSSDTQEIVINHVYPGVGFYDVRMNASNDVSMVTQEMVAVVRLFVCRNPNVTVAGLSPNSSNVLNAAQVYRSMPIALSTENVIDCEITDRTKTKWTVFKFDDDPRVLRTVPVSSLRKAAYHSDISTSELLLPGRDLPYGFYEISARVEMTGLPDVFGSDSVYIQVVQTPWLQAAVIGGSFYTAPFGFIGILNSSASSDPDFTATDGMSSVWYCRDSGDHEFISSNLTHEPLVSNDDPVPLLANESLGCFGSGRGRINTTNSTLQLDTKKMIEEKTYVILLVVSTSHPEFGIRQAMTTIFFRVESGIPPQLQTSCSKNCKVKIISDEKTILQSECSAFCSGELTFSWSLYCYDDINTPEPLNLSSLHEIPQSEFQDMVYNPINELDLAIKPYSLLPGKKYTLAFRATRPTGALGELRTTLLVNSPPAGGTCAVSPSSGIALSTNFTFTCVGWTDPESPLTYEFAYGNNQMETLFHFRTIASGTKFSLVDWLPAGEESSNYTLTVTAKVKDSYGSSSIEQFMIQVRPLPEEELNATKLKDLFAEHLANGDTLAALSLASVLSSTMNTLGSGSTASPEQVREEMLISLSGVEPQDMSASMQVSGSLSHLVGGPDQMTPKAQDAALTVTESIVEKMKSLVKDDEGFKNVKSTATNILGSLGSMNSGSSKDSGSLPQNKTVTAVNAQRTVDVVGQLQDILLDYLVTNEGPNIVKTETLSISAEKISANAFGEKESTLKKGRFKPPSAAAFGLGDVLSNPNNSFLQMQPIDVKVALFDKNPFSWDNTSESVTSNVMDIVVESQSLNVSSSNLTEDIAVTIPRDPTQFVDGNNSFYLKPHEMNSTSRTKDYMKFHCFTRRSNYTAMNFEIKPEDLGIHLNVFLKKGGKPDAKTGDYEFAYKLPDVSTCKVGNDSVHTSQSQSGFDETVHIDPSKCAKDPYTVFVSNVDFNGTGEYCFGVQHTELFHNETYPDPESTFGSRNRRSVSCEVGARRVRRSCVIIPPAPPKPTDSPGKVNILVADNLGFDGKFFYPNQTPNYNLTMFESSCIFWDVVNETWKGGGCRVTLSTNREQILCLCNHLTSFGSDLLVAPNPIDFDSVFSNFGSLAENVAVLALISTILGVYIIGVIWARRADKRDLLMIGPTVIQKGKGNYCYLITTATGSRQGAGTTARVVFTMSGDQGETLPVRLHDRERPCFERGQTNSFVIAYPHGVGDLSYVQIWHDNSGSSPSWYLSRFTVKDLQTGTTWKLVCENWLAVESEDGKVCRLLPVANEQELTNFNHVFSKKALTGLADGHIWFSIVSRPPTSNFTRVQRLSCALCLLCCTMITSAMFYNMGGQGPSPFAVHIGSLVIDLKPFVIGLQSSVIIVPVNVLIVQIFRNLRPKKEKPKRTSVYEVEKDEHGREKDGDLARKEEDIVHGVQIENQNPPKGKLPYCFIYPAYAICYLASAASVFFTLLYSIQWGKETSTEWVIAMVTSFLQSVLLLQPIKVVLAAVVFALCVKSASDSEEERYDEGLVIRKPDQEKQVAANNLAELERKMQAIGKPPGKIKRYYSPPDPARLRKAREKRLKELKMNAALKEMFAFFVFLILLMDVAQYHRHPDTFLLTKTLYETFEEVDGYGIDLAAISDGDSLWMWSRETLVPGLYANEWYNGKKIEKGWLANIEDYLVGVPRVRLVRVEEDSCPVSSYFKDIIPHCYSGYSVTSEDDDNYGVGWEPLTSGTSRKRRDVAGPETETEWMKLLASGSEMEHSRVEIRQKRGLDPIMGGASGKNRRKKKRLLASSKPKEYRVNDNALLPDGRVLSCLERWDHQSMIDLRGFPYWGTITMYSGGGYVANLGYDQVTAYTVVADLHSNGWLDVQTRAVFVEFTVYNANTNLFGILSYFIEFSPSSIVVTTSQYQVARFYLHLTGGQTLAHVLVIFFMMYFLYREGKLVYKQRCAYFKGFWNWIEVILVVCEFLLIVLFLARLFEVDRNLLQLRENPNDYVGFQYAGNADALMTCVLGVLVFFYILRFLRLLRFNKNFLVIGKTFQRISAPILSFCLPFISGFFAFALLAFAIFGSELEDYSSFIRTMVTQFSMTLGDFDFEAIYMVNPTVATLYFFSFIGLNVMVLMNMFIAIINDSFAEVQEETADIQNELEIVDYVAARITRGFKETFHRGKVVPVKKKRSKKHKRKTGKQLPPYEQMYTELDLRVEKLELFVDIIDRSMEVDEMEEKRFCSVPEDKQQDLFFRLLCSMESAHDDSEDELSDSETEEEMTNGQ